MTTGCSIIQSHRGGLSTTTANETRLTADQHETKDHTDFVRATSHVMSLIERLFRGAHWSAVPEGASDPGKEASVAEVNLGNADPMG